MKLNTHPINLLMRKVSAFFSAAMVLFIFSCSPNFSDSDTFVEDKNYIIGTLDNGMKYYIYPTDIKKDQVLLQVTINTGSLYETEEERGLSHFIEHMAFNSTEKYNRKEFEKIERELGIGLGVHSNAYTSYQTVNYHIEMQDPSIERMNSLFDVMSQRTLHMTFDQNELDQERGIILSEKQIRSANPYWDRYFFYQDTLLEGTAYPDRSPIGLEEVIKTVTPEEMKALYDRSYIPSRMAVSVIGDVNVDEVKSLMQKYFGSVSNEQSEDRQSQEEVFFAGSPSNEQTTIKGFYDPSQKTSSLVVTHIEDLNFENNIQSLKEELINSGLQAYMEDALRYYQQAKKYDSAIINVSIDKSDLDSVYAIDSFSIDIDAQRFDEGLIESEAFISGFYQHLDTEGALKSVKEKINISLDELYVLPRPQIWQISSNIVENFIYGFPLIDLQKNAIKYGKKISNSITNKDIKASMDRLFNTDTNQFLFLFVGDDQRSLIDENHQISESLNLAQVLSTELTENSFVFEVQKEFEIEDVLGIPKTGSIIDEQYHEEKGFYTWDLSNGNTVLFKQRNIEEENNTQLVIHSVNDAVNYNFTSRNPFLSNIMDEVLLYTTIKDIPMQKVLDKFTPIISIDGGSVRVETNQKDYFEESFQELYLLFSGLQLTEDSFEQAQYSAVKSFEELLENPTSYTIKSMQNYTFKTYKYFKNRLDINNLTNTTYQEIADFTDALLRSKNTSFIIVANESPEKIKQFVEMWIASISTEHHYTINTEELEYKLAEKNYQEIVTRLDSKDVGYVVHGAINKKSPQDTISPRYQILSLVANDYIQYLANERLREELGSSYYVSTNSYIRFQPVPQLIFLSFFPTPVGAGQSTLDELKTLLANLVPVDNEGLETSKNLAVLNAQEEFKNKTTDLEFTERNLVNYVIEGINFYSLEEQDMLIEQIQSVTTEEIDVFLTELFEEYTFSIISEPNS